MLVSLLIAVAGVKIICKAISDREIPVHVRENRENELIKSKYFCGSVTSLNFSLPFLERYQ